MQVYVKNGPTVRIGAGWPVVGLRRRRLVAVATASFLPAAAACLFMHAALSPPCPLPQLTYKEGGLSGQAIIRGAYVNTASKVGA